MKKELRNDFGKLYLTVEYDPENNWVLNTWIGYETTENVINGANACLEALKLNNCHYLLNDNLKVVGSWDKSINWITTDWAPKAVQIGLTHFAQVESLETFAAFSSEMMKNKIGRFFNIKIFHNRPEAEEWLRKVSVKKAGN